ncbi:hypothetical protein I656_02757 [Geobacillus sp. WSUCF1]|nr:hypothetical protein I656_02757 [Geobacillus sp. WSUCF1]
MKGGIETGNRYVFFIKKNVIAAKGDFETMGLEGEIC